MTRLFRRLAALIAFAGFSLPASATSYGIDFTDLWYNASESGWGVNLIQQHETIFATLFVYGPDSSARWFVASDLRGGANNSFTGALYRTTGPAFGVAWTGTAAATQVGTMTLQFSDSNTGTLTYNVDSVTVTKQVTRQTWRAQDIAGNYEGGLSGTASNCRNPADAGTFRLVGFIIAAMGTPDTTIRLDFVQNNGATARCNFVGPFVQAGRLGTITGTMACTYTSATISFTLSEIDVTRNGLNARFNGNDGFCTLSGFFGGVRRSL